MNEERKYVPKSYARGRKTKIGEIIGLDFHAETLIDFIRKNTNERGYFKIDVVPRMKPDERSTHSLILNDWKPQKPKSKIDDDDVPPF